MPNVLHHIFGIFIGADPTPDEVEQTPAPDLDHTSQSLVALRRKWSGHGQGKEHMGRTWVIVTSNGVPFSVQQRFVKRQVNPVLARLQ
jgi:hypothetical protein